MEGLIPRTKTAGKMVQMVKRQIQPYALRGCPVQQSEDSSSDINHFRQVSIRVFDLEGESEAVSLGMSIWDLSYEKGLKVRTLFHRMDAGQNWAYYQARDSGTRNSQNSNLRTRIKALDCTGDMILSPWKMASFWLHTQGQNWP